MYVFGNGESRTSVNINNLQGIKVGCNAIYRDYHMDHLVCVDRRMVQEVLDNEIQGYLSWMDHYRSLNITPEFINVLKTRIPRGDSDKQLELKQLILNLIPDDILSGEIVAEVQPTVAEVPEEQQKVAAAEAKAPEEQPDEFQQFKIIYRDTIIDLGKKIEDIERRLSAIETNEDIAGGNLDINQNNSIYKVMYTKIKE